LNAKAVQEHRVVARPSNMLGCNNTSRISRMYLYSSRSGFILFAIAETSRCEDIVFQDCRLCLAWHSVLEVNIFVELNRPTYMIEAYNHDNDSHRSSADIGLLRGNLRVPSTTLVSTPESAVSHMHIATPLLVQHRPICT
jgi:hypothetical protein